MNRTKPELLNLLKTYWFWMWFWCVTLVVSPSYELLEKGKFNPVIDREYVLEDIPKAYEYVIKGQKTGNVLINM